MVRRARFACLFPVVVFIVLRALSHAHPAPLPWTKGVFDADGLDDLLKTIRIKYSQPRDPHLVLAGSLTIPTGRVVLPEVSTAGRAFLSAPRSRAPPGS